MPPKPAIAENITVNDLLEHPDNPRRGDVRLIAESIEINGFYGALVVQRSTNHVLVGNHRLKAARLLGMEKVPVVWADVDDATARRILLADNRVAEMATYDDPALAKLLAELAVDDSLAGTGWDNSDLADILAILEKEAPPTELELEEAAAKMREKVAAQPRIVIDTNVETVALWERVGSVGDSNHDKLVSMLKLAALRPAEDEPETEQLP